MLANFQRFASKVYKTLVEYNNCIIDKFCPNDTENIRDNETKNRYSYKKPKALKTSL